MTPAAANPHLDAVMTAGPVVPVVTLPEVRQAVPLARALLAGGIGTIEVTLRTAAGLEAIRAIAAEVPDIVVGAGTVLDVAQARAAAAAGARFFVSPGLTSRLVETVGELDVPLLPGVSTASEAMMAMEFGITRLKFFPAEPAGGVSMLKALHGPLRDLRFCPTGGIDLNSAADYLACPNVACVGGSWLTPGSLLARGDWDGIAALARSTVDQLRRPTSAS